MVDYIMYTDGACRKDGTGGYAAIIIKDNHEFRISGRMDKTTNNRMELMAVIKGLISIKDISSIHVYSDSRYVIDGSTKWMKKWKTNGFIGQNNPIKNVDLWKALDEQLNRHNVSFQWIRGHSGNYLNEQADRLATNAINAKPNVYIIT